MLIRLLMLMLVLVPSLWLAGCGDDSGETDTPSGPGPTSETFEEGTMRVEIETLDTGLLKGHAYADASEGWTVEGFRVEAHDEDGTSWQVIQADLSGVGGPNVEEFFEVVIQELPRGEQISVEAIAIFGNEAGSQVEQRLVDNWPP